MRLLRAIRRRFLKTPRLFFRNGRRVAGLLLLASICLSFIPLPAPTRAIAGKDRSQAFPCQDRPCGCQTAEQCWKGCCCFTNTQKVAWATKNGVRLPSYVVAKAREEAAAPVCCKSDAGSCCKHDDDAEGKATVTMRDDTRTKYVIGFFAQRCQGENPFAAGAVLPWSITPPLTAHLNRQLTNELSPLISDSQPLAVFYRPPVPPPRAA